MVSFDEILDPSTMDERIPWHGKVDKNGRFYHATQRAANKEFIFDKELGQIQAQHSVQDMYSFECQNSVLGGDEQPHS